MLNGVYECNGMCQIRQRSSFSEEVIMYLALLNIFLMIAYGGSYWYHNMGKLAICKNKLIFLSVLKVQLSSEYDWHRRQKIILFLKINFVLLFSFRG